MTQPLRSRLFVSLITLSVLSACAPVAPSGSRAPDLYTQYEVANQQAAAANQALQQVGAQLTATAAAPTVEAQRTQAALSAQATTDALQLQRDLATSTAQAALAATQLAAANATVQAASTATVAAQSTQESAAVRTQAWVAAQPERDVQQAQAALDAARLVQERERVQSQVWLGQLEDIFWAFFRMLGGLIVLALLALGVWAFFFRVLPVLRRRIGWYRDERTGRSVMVMDASDDVHVIAPERLFTPGLASGRSGLALGAAAPTPQLQAAVTDAAQKVELAALVRRLPVTVESPAASASPVAVTVGHARPDDALALGAPAELPALPRPGVTRVTDITVLEPGHVHMAPLLDEVEAKLAEL